MEVKASANYNPKLWGNCGWQFLHYIALGYSNKPTEENRQHYKNFMMELGYVIPCAECRENFIKHSSEILIDDHLDNSQNLFDWVIKIQNKTNQHSKTARKKVLDSELMKKYYVNEQRRLDSKNCCGLKRKSQKLWEKIQKN